MVASAWPATSATTRFAEPGTQERSPNLMPILSSMTLAIESVPPCHTSPNKRAETEPR